MSKARLYQQRLRLRWFLVFCFIGVLLLIACQSYDKTATIHPQDGLELTLKYVGQGSRTNVSFYGDDEKIHLFNVESVYTIYDRKDRMTEYVTVYLSDAGVELHAVIHLWETKNPANPALTTTPESTPTP